MTYRSLKILFGVIENFLVIQVSKFIILTNFTVLEMENVGDIP